MQESSLEEIRKAAHLLRQQGKSWHFHILSPGCTFSTSDQHTFVLETSSDEPLAYYSSKPEKELGAELSPLLHKPESVEAQEQDISDDDQHILDVAKRLNDHGIEWHHHVLFPGCVFNDKPNKFCLILENSKTSEVLKTLGDSEPRHVLKDLEPLFYKK